MKSFNDPMKKERLPITSCILCPVNNKTAELLPMTQIQGQNINSVEEHFLHLGESFQHQHCFSTTDSIVRGWNKSAVYYLVVPHPVPCCRIPLCMRDYRKANNTAIYSGNCQTIAKYLLQRIGFNYLNDSSATSLCKWTTKPAFSPKLSKS